MRDSWNDVFEREELDSFAAISGLKQQLLDGAEEVFEDTNNFWLFKACQGVTTAYHIENEVQLDKVLQEPLSGLTVISINSSRTNAPLNISSSAAGRLYRDFRVKPDFLRVMLSFGKGPQQTDASHGYEEWWSAGSDEYIVSYKLNFFERNVRAGPNPWSSRHVGIYHHHRAGSDLFIVLNSVEKTAFLNKLEHVFTSGPVSPGTQRRISEIEANPELLHLMALTTYADNWKPYFELLSSQFNRINDRAMVTSADQMSQESFERVQNLRHLHDKTLFANACCDNNIQIVKLLSTDSSTFQNCTQTLKSVGTSLTGFRSSSGVLQRRIQNAIDMVGYNLTLHNQLETAKLDTEIRDMTRHMENLAQENRDLIEGMRNLAQETSIVTKRLQELQQDSVDDSGIVNIITLASVIYLPGSFVGSIFGMNFFDFDTESRRLVIGDNFWLFVVIWLIFFVITVVIFVLAWWVKKRDIPRPWRRSARQMSFRRQQI